jgi:hypothetical protein
MSLKKTDMVKNLAKKLDGRMKTAGVPQRFAQGSAQAAAKRDTRPAVTTPKLVPLACRLPADLLGRARERAVGREGGINAVLAEALAQWLESDPGAPPPAKERA